MLTKDKKVLMAYLAVCIFWGSTYLAIRIGVESFPPLVFAGSRFLVAGLIMYAFSKYKKYTFPKTKKELFHVAVTGLFLLTGANSMVVIAEQWVESGMVSLIVAICPIMIMLIEVVILKRYKIGLISVIGIFIGFIGVAYLVLGSKAIGNVHVLGIILTVLAPMSWAIGSVYSQVNKVEGDIVPIIACQMLAGGMGQLIIGIFRGELMSLGTIEMSAVYAWLYLIFFGSLIGYSCYIYILQKLPASIAGTYAYVNPVVAVLLGGMILNEPITFTVVISTVIIISGVALVTQTKGDSMQVAENTSE